MGLVKTTLKIHYELLARAKQHTSDIGRPRRAVVEEGLRLVRSSETAQEPYVLPDRSYGGPETYDPLAAYMWMELRNIIYGDNQGP